MQLVWLRKDLRVIDNTALCNAIETGDFVVAIYVATPGQWREHSQSPIQSDLIFRRLVELKGQLSSLNIPLLYSEQYDYSGAARTVVKLGASFVDGSVNNGVTIHINKEYELNEIRRDALLGEVASSEHINVSSYHDKCVFKPNTILNGKGEMFKVFTPFKKKWVGQFAQSQRAVAKPTKVKVVAYEEFKLPDEVEEFDVSASFSYPRKDSHAYPVTDEAISEILDGFITEKVAKYHQNRDFPSILGTSLLSPYLAIGAISVRQCISGIDPHNQGEGKWLDELIWREFYTHLSYSFPEISKGEPFHVWGKHIYWKNEPQHFKRWCSGDTGYPIVDAAMRQLIETGWMHNRLRMIVASFLTKDLLVDWRLGEEYFMSQLVDGDYASNNGGWQWCASTGCDGQPYFRIFNPITQSEKFDAEGKFIRQWVPELSGVPDKYIHQPWLWSEYGSLSYPEPIVDHKVQREIALALYKAAKDQYQG